VISTCLAQFTLLLPLGGRVLRAGLAANLGGAFACLIYFHLLHRLLAANAHTPRLTLWLSMLGSLLLCLSDPMQSASSAAGGGSVAFALTLGALAVHARLLHPATQPAAKGEQVLLGVLAVAALFEQLWAGIAIALFVGIERALSRGAARVHARAVALGALLAAGACSVPLLLMLRPHRTLPELPMLGESLALLGDLVQLNRGGVHWWADPGSVLLVAAVLGACWATAKPLLRANALSWLGVLVTASVVGTAPTAGQESMSSVLRLAAFAAVVMFATIATQTAALLLIRSRAAYVGGSVFLLPTAYALLIAVHADEADIHAESARRNGNDVFTQEAIWTLPRNAILLLNTPELAQRVWAERLAHGMRSDVLVITPRQLQRRSRINRLLQAEPVLAPLVRDWVLRGRPSEYVLSQLADVRPVFLELDRTWDQRVREHLSAWGLWLEYHSQTLGRSDRYAKMATTRTGVERVIEISKGSVPPDSSTLHFVAMRLKEQVLVSAGLGDRPMLYPLLDQLDRTGAERAFAKSTRKMLEEKPLGPIDWAALQAL
jgi:hypothetical protein